MFKHEEKSDFNFIPVSCADSTLQCSYEQNISV